MPDTSISSIPAVRSGNLGLRIGWLASLFILCTHSGWALNRDSRLVDLLHTGWTAKDGAPAGGVRQLAQTSDGFLWMTSSAGNGLYRFDGHFDHIELPRTERLSSMAVFSLFAPKSGGLWIGFTFGGAAFLKDGKLTVYNEKDGLPPGSVKDFAEDSDGLVWAATTRGLAYLSPSGWKSVASLDNASADPQGLLFDTQGTLWITCTGKVLLLPKGAKVLEVLPEHVEFPSVAESSTGIVWLGDLQGIRPIRKIDNPSGLAVSSAQRMLIDRDGSIWAVNAGPGGVLRIARSPDSSEHQLIRWEEQYGAQNGLTSNLNSYSPLEDREGNVWIGTSAGLDRFSNRNLKRELDLPERAMGLAANNSGGVWIGSARANSLGSAEDGRFVTGTPARNISCLLRADDGSVWFGGAKGIWHYTKVWSDRIPLPLAAEGQEVQAMAVDRSGSLWVSIVRRGVFRWSGGVWSDYTDLPGLPKETAVTLSVDASGRLWLGYTDNRIAVVDKGSLRLFSVSDGIKVGSVTAIYSGRTAVWVGGEFGLAVLEGERFRDVVPPSSLDLQNISGIIETADGDVWLNCSNGVVHFTSSEIAAFRAGKKALSHGEVFGVSDGLEGTGEILRPHPTAVEGGDGKLWFSTNVAIFSLDPKHLYKNSVKPPVVITSLKVGETAYPPINGMHLPAHSTALRIDYVGLSLTMPEKVRYRYKLEGINVDWQDTEGRQEAYFVNINPGTYRFHVIAANNDGVWNDNGATLDFVIPPMFRQTYWFLAACLFAGGTLIVLIFQFRMRQLAAGLRLRLNERLRERERIARELHDTLLQSTQGLMLRVQAARNRIATDEPARQMLDSALKRADEVLAEARDRVQDLRIPPEARADIVRSLCAIGDELALGRAVTFRVVVEGQPRELRSRVVDEAYGIVREALLNAFHHAQATSIEILIVFGISDLQLQVRDNGCGIDLLILAEESRAGHWGLKGMRERAHEIGAQFEILSDPVNGTRIDLKIPSAFATSGRLWGRWRWPLARSINDI